LGRSKAVVRKRGALGKKRSCWGGPLLEKEEGFRDSQEDEKRNQVLVNEVNKHWLFKGGESGRKGQVSTDTGK